MDPDTPRYVAVVGCGPSGCMVVRLLQQSRSLTQLPAKVQLVAIDTDPRALEESGADVKVRAQPGGALQADLGAFEVVFPVFDPSEPGPVGWAGEVASRSAADGAYTFGVAVSPPGERRQGAEDMRSRFGGVAVVDAGWVLEKRGGEDPVMALQIAFNFTAHTLTFLAGAIAAGDLSAAALRSATEGRTTAFAASHISDPISIYSLTMSRIDRAAIKSGIVFLDEAIEDVPARRIFYAIGRSLPKAELVMIRTKGLEPFKILAMLAS
ncbi:MAG TPA: hypothetical protein VLT35_07475 [Methanocella sp.]|nr:hypothetical protein [Methanocella sp.]